MGFIIRLAGPLQSWGAHSVFTHRDTLRFPTRSGLIGMFAAAQGRRRGAPLDDYDDLRLTIRIDRPGVVIRDFHTIGGGYPRESTVPTAEGKRRSAATATIVTHRNYLADAVFTVAVQGPTDRIHAIADALACPHWPIYLGRRSCPPDQPLLLRSHVDDPITHLTDHIPVAARPPRTHPEAEHPTAPDDDNAHELDFITEDTRDSAESTTEIADVPRTTTRLDRRFGTRTVAITPRPVAAHLWFTTTHAYHDALIDYIQEER